MGQSNCWRMFSPNSVEDGERMPLQSRQPLRQEGGLNLPPQQVVSLPSPSSSSLQGANFPQPPPVVQAPKPDPRPPVSTPWVQQNGASTGSSSPAPGVETHAAGHGPAAEAAPHADQAPAPAALPAAPDSGHVAPHETGHASPHDSGPAAPHDSGNAAASASTSSPSAPPPTQAASAAQGGHCAAHEAVQLVAELPGRRRSLLVGINYFGTSSELSGCVNDVLRVRPVLAEKWGFQQGEETQRVLLDSPDWPQHLRPTLANMRAAIDWLAAGAATGDALYLHYSGHGGREPRHDGVEGFHETLCPVDYETAGMLVDTELFDRLVRSLPAGCRLTCVLDCCHSAGALDLPYVFVGSKQNLDKALAGEAMELAVSKSWAQDLARASDGRPEALLGDIASMGLGLWELYRKRQATKGANEAGFAGSEAAGNAGLAVGEVIAFTGCRSDQTSADVGDVHQQFQGVAHVSDGGTGGAEAFGGARVSDHAGGALTAVFLESLASSTPGELTYLSLLERMRQRLQSEGFSQVPQLASSLLLELQQRFSLTTVFVPPAAGSSRGVGSGFDETDAALLGGTASCAAGFLAALASAQHGGSMLQGAQSHSEWRREIGGEREVLPSGDLVGAPLEGWGTGVPEAPGAPLSGWGGEQAGDGARTVAAEPAAPLHSWGNEQAVGVGGISAAEPAAPLRSFGNEEAVGVGGISAAEPAAPLRSFGNEEVVADRGAQPQGEDAELEEEEAELDEEEGRLEEEEEEIEEDELEDEDEQLELEEELEEADFQTGQEGAQDEDDYFDDDVLDDYDDDD